MITKSELLTVRWNNLLTLILGLPILAYIITFLMTSIFSDNTGFIILMVLGAGY